MDPFTHTFVGLATAKAGLERLSPLSTTVCVLAASSPDADVVVAFVTDRWTYLHHHRGITHSIVGVLALACIVPAIVWAVERVYARLRKTKPRARYRGLLVASLVVTATHPLMDWTNNYGVRPLLPWSGRWFYGDLVYIVDPYLLVILGGAAFLAHSNRRLKTVLWAVFASFWIVAALGAVLRPDRRLEGAVIALVVLLVGVVIAISLKYSGFSRGRERKIAVAALAAIAVYWGALGFFQRVAYNQAGELAVQATATLDERVNRWAAMPTLANPLHWSCVAETDRAIYRFFVNLGDSSQGSPPIVDGFQTDAPEAFERFEKPTGRAAELSNVAAQDRRARILLNFSRFPLAHPQEENCIGQTIVQIADLRYTEPGATRGSFSLNLPVECASK